MPLSVENLANGPIADGDAGIILKADGSFQIFTTGNVDPKALTPAQLAQGQKLLALTTALTVPELMTVLTEAANELGYGIDAVIERGATH